MQRDVLDVFQQDCCQHSCWKTSKKSNLLLQDITPVLSDGNLGIVFNNTLNIKIYLSVLPIRCLFAWIIIALKKYLAPLDLRTQVYFHKITPSKTYRFIILTLWLPGRNACQDPDILVWEFYFSSFEAGIANAISSFKWRKIHKCSIYLTKICVILRLRSLTNDDGNFRHVW